MTCKYQEKQVRDINNPCMFVCLFFFFLKKNCMMETLLCWTSMHKECKTNAK